MEEGEKLFWRGIWYLSQSKIRGGCQEDYLSFQAFFPLFGSMDSTWGWLGKGKQQKERDSSDEDKTRSTGV